MARFLRLMAVVPAWCLAMLAPISSPAAVDCGRGVSLTVTNKNLHQGQLTSVYIASPRRLLEVKGQWSTQPLEFWPSLASQAPVVSKMPERWTAFVAIDLEKPIGTYSISVNAEDESGAEISCNAEIVVAAGRFATEKLTVSKQFVEPDPQQLARSQAERQRLLEIYGKVSPEKLWSGPFRVPLDGVMTGGNFGKRRVLNGQASSPHTVVDFPAPTGTPVHATQDGKVVLAEELFFAGNSVIVDHGLGIYTLYCHLSRIDVQPGDPVREGQVLGAVGATGRVTGPHLHWGLTVEGAHVNALDLVTTPRAAPKTAKVKKKR